jgi:hypothetical protein
LIGQTIQPLRACFNSIRSSIILITIGICLCPAYGRDSFMATAFRDLATSQGSSLMADAHEQLQYSGVLVSHFDGTRTHNDFYRLTLESLLPPDLPDDWEQYCSGAITQFEALRLYFAAIRTPEDEVLALVDRMQLDPKLFTSTEVLRTAVWRVMVTGFEFRQSFQSGRTRYLRPHSRNTTGSG